MHSNRLRSQRDINRSNCTVNDQHRSSTASVDINQRGLITFHDVRPDFVRGSDALRAYLECCLATIDERESAVQAWVTLYRDAALASTVASTERYRRGEPLSSIDGMPVGIKDVLKA